MVRKMLRTNAQKRNMNLLLKLSKKQNKARKTKGSPRKKNRKGNKGRPPSAFARKWKHIGGEVINLIDSPARRSSTNSNKKSASASPSEFKRLETMHEVIDLDDSSYVDSDCDDVAEETQPKSPRANVLFTRTINAPTVLEQSQHPFSFLPTCSSQNANTACCRSPENCPSRIADKPGDKILHHTVVCQNHQNQQTSGNQAGATVTCRFQNNSHTPRTHVAIIARPIPGDILRRYSSDTPLNLSGRMNLPCMVNDLSPPGCSENERIGAMPFNCCQNAAKFQGSENAKNTPQQAQSPLSIIVDESTDQENMRTRSSTLTDKQCADAARSPSPSYKSPERGPNNPVIILDSPMPEKNTQNNLQASASKDDDVIVIDDNITTTCRKRSFNESNNEASPKRRRNSSGVIVVDDDDEQSPPKTVNIPTGKGRKKRRKRPKALDAMSQMSSSLTAISGVNLTPFLAPQPSTHAAMGSVSGIGSRLRYENYTPNLESGDFALFRSRDNEIMNWLTNNDPSTVHRSDLSKQNEQPKEAGCNGDFSETRETEFGPAPSLESVRNKFGTNFYNPNTVIRKGLRTIVIDGSNVALGHTNGRFFSVKGLKICIDYFRAMGHTVRAFVPQFRINSGESSDPSLLRDLSKEGVVIFTPSRVVQGRRIVPYDDRFIVQYAAACDGVIVSNDNFRDVMKENPTLRPTIEQRLLMFTWVDDMIIFPPDPLGQFGPSLDEFLRFPMSIAIARNLGAVLVSNDEYLEVRRLDPTLIDFIENNLLMYTFVEDMIMFPHDPKGRRGPKLMRFLRH